MRIVELTLLEACIPLKRRVRHALHERRSTDSLLARCRLDSGDVGWGEGLPRTYVTGETCDNAWDLFGSVDLGPLSIQCEKPQDVVSAHGLICWPLVRDYSAGFQRECFGNSLRCAIELAMLDAFCRGWRISLREFLGQLSEFQELLDQRQLIQYSGVITTMQPLRAGLLGALYRMTGFRACKVKVGATEVDDARLLSWVRRGAGHSIDLRIDANCAWNADEVEARMQPLLKCGISALEQPVPHEQIGDLAKRRKRQEVDLPCPVILDESLCSEGDAAQAIEQGWGEIFNIRLSKCGGVLPSLRIAQAAAQAGLRCLLGCQVGETGILSAAGRQFATNVKGLLHVEGSFDRFLVQERLTREDLTFGWAGRATALDGFGLGVTVDAAAVQRVTRRVRSRVL